MEMKTIIINRRQKYDGAMVADKKERAVTAARPEENPLWTQRRDGDTSILDMTTRLSGSMEVTKQAVQSILLPISPRRIGRIKILHAAVCTIGLQG